MDARTKNYQRCVQVKESELGKLVAAIGENTVETNSLVKKLDRLAGEIFGPHDDETAQEPEQDFEPGLLGDAFRATRTGRVELTRVRELVDRLSRLA